MLQMQLVFPLGSRSIDERKTLLVVNMRIEINSSYFRELIVVVKNKNEIENSSART